MSTGLTRLSDLNFVFAASQFLLDPVTLDLFLVCLSSHFTDYFRLLFLEGALPVFTFHTLPTVFSRYFSLLLFSFLVGEQVWIFLDTSGFALPREDNI